MSEVTAEQFLIIYTCMWGGFALSAGFAWVVLYKLWRRYFHGKRISSVYQLIKLLGWLLLVALICAYTWYGLRLLIYGYILH